LPDDRIEEEISITEAQELLPLLPPHEQEKVERQIAKIVEKETLKILRALDKTNTEVPLMTAPQNETLVDESVLKLTAVKIQQEASRIAIIDKEIQEKFPSLTTLGGQVVIKKNKRFYRDYEII